MTASEIRQSFLDFFGDKDHRIVPSAPVVPGDDPTLLFTNAGMNQFKDVFLGTGTRPYSRAVDAQKCIRVSGKHNDLEEVGMDTYHHTFFEMMGNWSFGDYYKTEAIAWAWELVTEIWGLPKKSLWATVFREDDEAETIWKKVTDIDGSRVLRFDEKDNFWEMGEIGPCGPCSELHIDLGEGYCDKQHIKGHRCGVNAGCGRFIELWNLVFIQYNRDESGTLTPLPEQHVDTGLGLERAVAVLQNKRSNYQTDLFTPIIHALENRSGRTAAGSLLPAYRVIADHIRALTFAITDGAIPSNEGRGYVLRRILRRAARYGRNIDLHEPFIYELVPKVVDIMGDAYPEIRERAQHTTLVIKAEEERFNEVLDRGIDLFEKLASDLKGRGGRIIPGKEAFRLYDTFGFPLDLTQLLAREKALEVDEAGFEKALEGQRKRAREAGKFSQEEEEWTVLSEGSDSVFTGYETFCTESAVRMVRRDGNDGRTVILDKTPFYGESGGQVGDTGEIKGDAFTLEVVDTQLQGDRILHIGRLTRGSEVTDQPVEACVDGRKRMMTQRNHTATHLLHKALRTVLGDHVNQAGSLVAPERLRFDFTHFAGMKREQIDEVEALVNRSIREDMTVTKFESTLDQAKADGATALFGEKYGDSVRVVKIDEYSMELCGGTHLNRTGQIGYFRILKEEGIAAGVRRIEAVTGEEADRILREENHMLQTLEAALKTPRDELETRISALLDERKRLEKQVKNMHRGEAVSLLDEWIQNGQDVHGIKVVTATLSSESADELRSLGDRLRDRLGSGVGVLASVNGEKVQFLCVVTDDLIRKQLKAGEIVRKVAAVAGGSGGGKPHLAMAGGKDRSKVAAALDEVRDIIGSLVKRSGT